MWRTASATDSYRPVSEDRAVIERRNGWAVVAVADGVGGRAGGGTAAEMVVDAAKALADQPGGFLADAWGWLSGLDEAIGLDKTAGETTAVVGILRGDGVFGVAVGDSAAWLIQPGSFRVLTRGSEPRPWLGCGMVGRMPFGVPLTDFACLLLATDGLLKYAKASAICEVVRTAPFDDIPKRLIDLARMPNGELQDDVAVIVARWEPGDATQQEQRG